MEPTSALTAAPWPRFDGPVTSSYRELIDSSRVSSVTRQALAAQARKDDPGYAPRVLDVDGLHTLRALVGRIIPQPPSHPVDLAARIDRRLADGIGDGWRLSALPADCTAYRRGLRSLDRHAGMGFGAPFSQLTSLQQDALLTQVAAGRCDAHERQPGDDRHGADESTDVHDLTGAQLRDWFMEVCADAVRLYVGHPQTLERVGYSGIANGGDGLPKSGFARLGLDEREDWEPLPYAGQEP